MLASYHHTCAVNPHGRKPFAIAIFPYNLACISFSSSNCIAVAVALGGCLGDLQVVYLWTLFDFVIFAIQFPCDCRPREHLEEVCVAAVAHFECRYILCLRLLVASPQQHITSIPVFGGLVFFFFFVSLNFCQGRDVLNWNKDLKAIRLPT